METSDGSFFVDWADGKPQLARYGHDLQVNLEVGFFADGQSLVEPPGGEWMKTQQGQLLTFYHVGWERATDGGTVSLGKLMRVVWTHNYGKFWILWCPLYQNWTELRISGVIVLFSYCFFFLLIYEEKQQHSFVFASFWFTWIILFCDSVDLLFCITLYSTRLPVTRSNHTRLKRMLLKVFFPFHQQSKPLELSPNIAQQVPQFPGACM